VHRLPPAAVEQYLSGKLDEKEVFLSAREFLEREAGVPVVVADADESMHPRAKIALPLKPAIIFE